MLVVMNYVKLSMSVIFFLEIVMRIHAAGVRNWFNIWSSIDLGVVVICMTVELLAVILHNMHFIRYDWLFVCFRVWYGVRMVRSINHLKEASEEKAIQRDAEMLKKCTILILEKQKESGDLEKDLDQMNKLIKKIEGEQIKKPISRRKGSK
ncbi:hypothetical protein DSO57_1012185 [Entomophthora muscae]|uniref:Uncharacterized protein n=1 Tax=Entomophthora muscae TaxID=34485 RepID=A0ACC2TGM5_9FUNG|nr:hypothetical protein DSO57_1012185 [Entomophthora muscae]